jgi:signal peptidase II
VGARKRTSWARLLIATGAVLLVDRLSKGVVVEALDLGQQIEVVPPYLVLIRAQNTGINFGIAAGGPELMRWLLVLLSVAISAALVWWVYRRDARVAEDDQRPRVAALAWGAGLVIGGALSNAWDRVQFGAVVDFLNMSCCGIANPYAFNIADAAIFAGAGLIALKA